MTSLCSTAFRSKGPTMDVKGQTRRGFGLALFALLVLNLTGCGGNPPAAPAAKDGAEQPAASTPKAAKLAVAAASDLKFAFDEVAAEFKKQYPHIDVQPTYGSSGNFFAQLSQKAPFDLYLSADIEYPKKLAAAGLALPDSEFSYAVGQIVVWVRKDSTLDVEQGLQGLADPAIRKIAIANPQHAPYGRAAKAALEKAGVYDKVSERLVLGENIAQTAQFVESGGADVGIVALSLAMAPAMKDRGRYFLVPQELYPRLEQGGVILSWTSDAEAARALREFMLGATGRTILARYGFVMPGE